MRHFLLALFALAGLMSAGPHPAQADTRQATVFYNLTGPELRDLFQGWGFPAELAADNDGNPVIHSSVQNINFTVFFYGCGTQPTRRCDSIGFSAGFQVKGLTPDRAIAWNRNYRFSKSYLDDQGNPFLAMNINIDGGVTAENLRAQLRWWEQSITDYLPYIGWQSAAPPP